MDELAYIGREAYFDCDGSRMLVEIVSGIEGLFFRCEGASNAYTMYVTSSLFYIAAPQSAHTCKPPAVIIDYHTPHPSRRLYYTGCFKLASIMYLSPQIKVGSSITPSL